MPYRDMLVFEGAHVPWSKALSSHSFSFGYSDEAVVIRQYGKLPMERRQESQQATAVPTPSRFTNNIVPSATTSGAMSATASLNVNMINEEIGTIGGHGMDVNLMCANCTSQGTFELTAGHFDISNGDMLNTTEAWLESGYFHVQIDDLAAHMEFEITSAAVSHSWTKTLFQAPVVGFHVS